jgi:hypothetical protein
MSSFGSAIVLPHFLHLETCNGSYMGTSNMTLGSGSFCSMKTLLSGSLIVF